MLRCGSNTSCQYRTTCLAHDRRPASPLGTEHGAGGVPQRAGGERSRIELDFSFARYRVQRQCHLGPPLCLHACERLAGRDLVEMPLCVRHALQGRLLAGPWPHVSPDPVRLRSAAPECPRPTRARRSRCSDHALRAPAMAARSFSELALVAGVRHQPHTGERRDAVARWRPSSAPAWWTGHQRHEPMPRCSRAQGCTRHHRAGLIAKLSSEAVIGADWEPTQPLGRVWPSA